MIIGTYKLAMAALENGPVPVLVVGDRVVGLAEATGEAAPAELIEVFSDWEKHDAALREAAARIVQADPAPGIALSQARFEAPLRYPRKVICAGANYYRHLVEMGVTEFEKTKPFFFFKPPTTTIVGPGDTVRYPTGGDGFDWEIELAVVIGRETRDVPLERALEAVAAYTVAIDLTERKLLFQAPEPFRFDWFAGKCQDTTCPIGPFVVPAAAIPDPQALALELSVNGVVKQSDSTSDMVFSVAELVAEASRFVTLEPGDLLLTGTPAGVGFPNQDFLKRGDAISATIEAIGTLNVSVQD